MITIIHYVLYIYCGMCQEFRTSINIWRSYESLRPTFYEPPLVAVAEPAFRTSQDKSPQKIYEDGKGKYRNIDVEFQT